MRMIAQVLGELVLTAGVLVLLFVVHLMFGTGWQTARDQDEASAELDRRWSAEAPAVPGPAQAPAPSDAPVPPVLGAPDPVPAVPGAPDAAVRTDPDPVPGDALARMFVPRFGRDWRFTVFEGVAEGTLARGPGHYPETALPGQRGNVAIAGHRVGRGGPFDGVESLQSCDAVVVETADTWWVYRVLPMAGERDGWATGRGARPGCAGVAPPVGDYAEVPGVQIVTPAERTVVAPVPGRPDAAPTGRLLTLTTCHPRLSARERLIVHAVLVRAAPKTGGRPVELREAV